MGKSKTIRQRQKPALFRGQALCSSWQPGYHSVTKRLRSYGFAPPPFNGLALGTIYVLLRNQYLSYLYTVYCRFL